MICLNFSEYLGLPRTSLPEPDASVREGCFCPGGTPPIIWAETPVYIEKEKVDEKKKEESDLKDRQKLFEKGENGLIHRRYC